VFIILRVLGLRIDLLGQCAKGSTERVLVDSCCYKFRTNSVFVHFKRSFAANSGKILNPQLIIPFADNHLRFYAKHVSPMFPLPKGPPEMPRIFSRALMLTVSAAILYLAPQSSHAQITVNKPLL
jgi:hypothetical protein